MDQRKSRLWKRFRDKNDKNAMKNHLEKLVAVIVLKNGVKPSGELFKQITSDKNLDKRWRNSDVIENFISKNLNRFVSK